jgi:hypothetical protein
MENLSSTSPVSAARLHRKGYSKISTDEWGVTAVPASGLKRSQQAVVRLFREGACIRVPREDRLAEGSDRYKKGWEIRLYVNKLGVERACTVLKRAGIEPGRAYLKSPNRWIVPVYGRDQVETVLSWAQVSNPSSD